MANGRKTGGRAKGTPNKINKALKEMVLAALDAKGGQAYLEQQADANPTAFLTLLGKILPTEVSGLNGDPIEHSLKVAFVGPSSN